MRKPKRDWVSDQIHAQSGAAVSTINGPLETAMGRWIDRKAARLGERLLNDYWFKSQDFQVRAQADEANEPAANRSMIASHQRIRRHTWEAVQRAEITSYVQPTCRLRFWTGL